MITGNHGFYVQSRRGRTLFDVGASFKTQCLVISSGYLRIKVFIWCKSFMIYWKNRFTFIIRSFLTTLHHILIPILSHCCGLKLPSKSHCGMNHPCQIAIEIIRTRLICWHAVNVVDTARPGQKNTILFYYFFFQTDAYFCTFLYLQVNMSNLLSVSYVYFYKLVYTE